MSSETIIEQSIREQRTSLQLLDARIAKTRDEAARQWLIQHRRELVAGLERLMLLIGYGEDVLPEADEMGVAS